MRRWRHVAVIAVVAACSNVEKRCQAIQTQQLDHELWTVAADRGRFNRDSVPPPPRPSEVSWYNEHCWQGKPR